MSDPSDPVGAGRLAGTVESGTGALQATTLDKLPIGVYRSTPDGRIVDANPALVALLGYPDSTSLLSTSAGDLYADPAERKRLLAQADRDGALGCRDPDAPTRRREDLGAPQHVPGARCARPPAVLRRHNRGRDRAPACGGGAVSAGAARRRALPGPLRARAGGTRTGGSPGGAATAALGSTLDLRQVLAVILRELQGVVPYDSATIQELRGDFMEVIAGHGFPDLERVLGTRFDARASDNPNREVFLTRRTSVLAGRTGALPRLRARSPAHASPWVLDIGVPLLFGDRLIGMLSLDKLEPKLLHPGAHAGGGVVRGTRGRGDGECPAVRRGQGGAGRTAARRGTAPPVAEDGGGGPAGRRSRARLQQPADRDPGLQRPRCSERFRPSRSAAAKRRRRSSSAADARRHRSPASCWRSAASRCSSPRCSTSTRSCTRRRRCCAA